MGASESKLAFKEDIFRLAGEENIPIESQWWARFFELPETPEDVQTLWSPNDLRYLTLNTPADRPPLHMQVSPKKNAETLIYRTISHLHALQTKNVIVHADLNTPGTSEILNGIRILTRILPYIYEADHLHDWEDRFFWQPRKPAWYDDPQTLKRTYYDGLDTEKEYAERNKNKEIGLPLGELMLDLLVNYLFFPNFTLPARNGLQALKPQFTVWQSGIGANKGAGMSKENEKNANEVLKLLLVLCSRSMYTAPNIVADTDMKPLTYLTTKSDRVVVLNTLCSLLNTVLKYNQNPWTNALDLGGITKDSKQSLVISCLHLLLILITYNAPNNKNNEFRKALGRLHRPEDFQFISEGLKQILMEPVRQKVVSLTPFLKGKVKADWTWLYQKASGKTFHAVRLTTTVPLVAPEMLSLFWELLQWNKRFLSYLVDTDRVKDFVVLVPYYAVEGKDDPAKQGIVRMCVFILQTLSMEENFAMKLNMLAPAQETLPRVLQIPNFHGSYADFLIGHIHNLLMGGNRGLESLHPALLAIINNIAPYVQDLQRATSSKLLNAFATMSQPSFLLANETNHVLLFSLLDAVNAILENQYEENRRFIDAVMKSRRRFEALRDFTVEGALAEVDRMTMERKDAGELTGIRSPVRNTSLDSVRSPTSARSPPLGNVPEHSAFTIGYDEDEEDESAEGISTPQSTSTSVMEDAVPMQGRSMSEKARGKQPIGQSAFSRTTSRNTSSTSLSTLPQVSTSQTTFTPTNEWLNTWLPYLPLHAILSTIENGDPGKNSTDEATGVKVQTFKWTSVAVGWYLSMVWSWVYAKETLWAGTSIRLFNVVSQRQDISLSSPKGAVDAAGEAIARRIGSLSLGSKTSMKEV